MIISSFVEISNYLRALDCNLIKVKPDSELTTIQVDKYLSETENNLSTLKDYLTESSFNELHYNITNKPRERVTCIVSSKTGSYYQVGYYSPENCDYETYLTFTKIKGVYEKQRVENNRYEVLMNLIEDAIIEINKNDIVEHCSKEYITRFGSGVLGLPLLDYIKQNNFIHKKDIEGFNEIYQMLKSGVCKCSTEIRFKATSGKYLWCEMSATTIKDIEGSVQNIVIVLKNINRERIMRTNLLNRVNRDELTGLYNKKGGLDLIQNLIKYGVEQGVLLFLDMDNFKIVNDTQGHLVGDEALKLVADCTKEVFRSEDIICRFGGDEFCIFMPESTIEVASKRSEHLQLLISNTSSIKGLDVKLGVSIGLAELKEGVCSSIGELLEDADKALYQAKEKGKGIYCVYERG